MEKLKVLDLFAGAGGMSSGFHQAGARIVGSIEKNKIYTSTHQINNDQCFSLCSDLMKIEPAEFEKISGINKGSINIIIGGPPCQSYSSIGAPKIKSLRGNDNTDPRNYLFLDYIKFVKHYKPDAFVMENVPNLKTKYNGQLFLHLLEEISSMGYQPTPMILNSVQFGVPQNRRRLFVVGVKSDIKYLPPAPIFNEEKNIRDILNPNLLPPRTVKDAIYDLPLISDGCREDLLPYRNIKVVSDYQKIMRNGRTQVGNNICRMSNERAKKIFMHMKQGDRYMDLPPDIRKILPFREDIFYDRLKRLDYSKPSWTVLAHIGMDGYMYIHPAECRTLSVREAARIQSFSDDFTFTGNMREQYIQVGNAVPPLLAKAVAESILGVLN